MTSTAFDGGARDEVVYITCSNPECRRSGCVTCWESVAESLEGWSRKKQTSFQMMQHPIFMALAKRAWRADAAGMDVLQRREGGGGSWTTQCPVCIDVDLDVPMAACGGGGGGIGIGGGGGGGGGVGGGGDADSEESDDEEDGVEDELPEIMEPNQEDPDGVLPKLISKRRNLVEAVDVLPDGTDGSPTRCAPFSNRVARSLRLPHARDTHLEIVSFPDGPPSAQAHSGEADLPAGGARGRRQEEVPVVRRVGPHGAPLGTACAAARGHGALCGAGGVGLARRRPPGAVEFCGFSMQRLQDALEDYLAVHAASKKQVKTEVRNLGVNLATGKIHGSPRRLRTALSGGAPRASKKHVKAYPLVKACLVEC